MKIAFCFLYLISLLPMSVIHGIAGFIGFCSYYLAKSRRHVGEVNLARCFPEKSVYERKKILKQHFKQMACMILEYGVCWYASAERIKNLVDIQDRHYLDDALAKGEKVIILYPHFCAFEITGFRLNQDYPLISVYAHQKNKSVDEQILKGRNRFKNAYLVGRTDGLLSIIRTIKKLAAPFVYLPDQDFGVKDSIFVPFFDIPTATTDGLARIAKLTKAKVIPAVATRGTNHHFKIQFYPPWENYPSADIIADTRKMNQFIEDRIREQPEQYYWLHKRFKTRPEREKSFYN